MTVNTIERLERAVFAQISPLTGTRATATMTVTALAGGGPVTLKPNSYLAPIVEKKLRDGWLFKVLPNPATATGSIPNGTWQGGNWTVPDGGTLVVDVVSNVGGAQHNLKSGTSLRFLPEQPGIEPLANLATAGAGGAGGGLVKRMVLFQSFTSPEAAFQYFAAGSGHFPALMLCWQGSQPLDGRTTGGNQGTTRKGRRSRVFQEMFTMYIAAGSLKGAHVRRNQGELAMIGATDHLTDRKLNIDCERLSSMGAGVEVTARRMLVSFRTMYIYQIDMVLNDVMAPDGDSAVDKRVYPDFAKANLTLALPGNEAPEPTDPLDLVHDVIIEP